jgi:hypothetical protein
MSALKLTKLKHLTYNLSCFFHYHGLWITEKFNSFWQLPAWAT